MKENLLPSLKLTLIFLVIFCGLYSLAVLAVAQLAPNQGRGEIIEYDGKTYYQNVAQSFTSDSYFWSRPSAVDYNAAGSGGSNKGPSNPDYLLQVQGRIDTFLVHNPGIAKLEIPSELVTASGAGLDPHISVNAAKVQAKRISAARNLSEEVVLKIIDQNTEQPLFGLFGTGKVNVLRLNIELDKIK